MGCSTGTQLPLRRAHQLDLIGNRRQLSSLVPQETTEDLTGSSMSGLLTQLAILGTRQQTKLNPNSTCGTPSLNSIRNHDGVQICWAKFMAKLDDRVKDYAKNTVGTNRRTVDLQVWGESKHKGLRQGQGHRVT